MTGLILFLAAYLVVAACVGVCLFANIDPYGHEMLTPFGRLWRAALYGLGWAPIAAYLVLVAAYYSWRRKS